VVASTIVTNEQDKENDDLAYKRALTRFIRDQDARVSVGLPYQFATNGAVRRPSAESSASTIGWMDRSERELYTDESLALSDDGTSNASTGSIRGDIPWDQRWQDISYLRRSHYQFMVAVNCGAIEDHSYGCLCHLYDLASNDIAYDSETPRCWGRFLDLVHSDVTATVGSDVISAIR